MPVEPIGVIEGKAIPPPFRPVDPISAMMSANPALAMLMVRQLKDMSGEMPDTSVGALLVLEKLEEGLKTGKDVIELNAEINRYIAGEEEHDELFQRLHFSHDRERAVEILKSRSKWEDFCHACMRRSDLNVIDGMAVMGYFNTQLDGIFRRIERKQSKGEAPATRDSQDLVERVNRPTLQMNKELQRKFDEAPPYEREILRKIAFKLENVLDNALAARITKTTETQTVEIIQQGGTESKPNV